MRKINDLLFLDFNWSSEITLDNVDMSEANKRTDFYAKVDMLMSYSDFFNESFYFVCFDIDNFESINTKYGYSMADKFLLEMERRVASELSYAETYYRSGGDEFVLILRSDYVDLQGFYSRLTSPILVEEENIHFSASVGLSHYPNDAIVHDTLFRYSVQSMHESKYSVNRKIVLFEQGEYKNYIDQKPIIEQIKKAIDKKQFILHYQPKINMINGDVIGYEALVRWEKDGKLIYPDYFLPLISNSALEVELGNEIVSMALRDLSKMIRSGKKISISVNVSPFHLLDPSFMEVIDRYYLRSPEIFENVCLEILESSILEDFDKAEEVISKCKGYGMKISLDDFGTAYSSFIYIKSLPVDEIKIDRSFVINMFDNDDNVKIIESILFLASKFNKKVVAEGVESHHHVNALIKLGCDVGQGYYYQRPVSFLEIY